MSLPRSSNFLRIAGSSNTFILSSLRLPRKPSFQLPPNTFHRINVRGERRVATSAGLDNSHTTTTTNSGLIIVGTDPILTMPAPPYTYYDKDSSPLPPFDLEPLGEEIFRQDERRKAAHDLNRRLQVAYAQAKQAVDQNMDETLQAELMQSMETLLRDPELMESNRNPRLGSLSYRVEDYCRLSAFRHFIQTSQLWPMPQNKVGDNDDVIPSNSNNSNVPVTDEEYLAGACMGVSQDLSRYALGRATVRDVASVEAAKELVATIMDFLIQIDFRNGPLRRKYDGVKYSLQALERFLYELAVTSSSPSHTEDSTTTEPAAKKHRSSKETPPALLELKQRMDHRDELREKLIKKCRDGQKAAKQAIFALHRGDWNRSTSLLEQCETCIKDLYPMVLEEPPLRSGSYANMLEEYVEGKLFAAWLEAASDGDTKVSGKLLLPSDFDSVIQLEPDEYLGGLCDLTGEIGRYAVQRGTQRDVDGVRLCLHSNQRILSAIQSMPVFPSGIGKKMDTLRRGIEKLERILYELSLSEAAGGRPVNSEGVAENEEQTNNDDE